MRQLQLAVAGAGLIGRRHIDLIQDSDRCRLAAIVDPGPGAAEAAVTAHLPLYRSLGELFENPSYDDEDRHVIAGDMGSLSVPTMRVKRYASMQERSWWKPFEPGVAGIDRADPLKRQLAHFCDVVAGSAQPLVTVYDGLQNLRITEAIAEAARTGAVVDTGRLSAIV
jgi:predicted dehydrogenase